MKTDISELNRLTSIHNTRQGELSGALTALSDELETVKRKHMAGIKRLAGAFAESESNLRAAVNSGRHLFADKKTMILNGVKVGLRAAKGSLVCLDEAGTVKLIRKHFPELADTLIETAETPKIAVIKGTLDESGWRKIGCELEGTGEHIVVTSMDSEVEKTIATMINKLVNAIIEQEELKEAA